MGRTCRSPSLSGPALWIRTGGAVFVLAPERSSELEVVREQLPGGAPTEVNSYVHGRLRRVLVEGARRGQEDEDV